ncbi:acetyltransferase [Paraburkholderia sp. UYCP14C]|uniref:acetyltransferase n=1 Tax=Paraburkholderia sp. UYCP14C TaxID=2511130 RepID=UPI00101EE8E2|nr:acetyltransferase [Paraburkholderia sp. UYCP14C]RZF25689.1 acetyltransferase [Paraburkholderia sp. UYCP14C]
MKRFDIFNGDADGICALHQLRLAEPAHTDLITGAKHEVALLRRAHAQPGDSVTVLDISLDSNRDPLIALLERGVKIDYFDHHFPGPIPAHALLTTHIDTSPEMCTALIVDRHLQSRYTRWAVVAAYGDNLHPAAHRAATACALNPSDEHKLRELGEAFNYNAYGDSVVDLAVDPVEMYRAIQPYADPLEFIAATSILPELQARRTEDLELAVGLAVIRRLANGTLHILPDAAWARRVQGEFANLVARRDRTRAHAVLTARADGRYMASVRAPLDCPRGADVLCRKFGGNGRVAAAGIDRLAAARLDEFAAAFSTAFGSESGGTGGG